MIKWIFGFLVLLVPLSGYAQECVLSMRVAESPPRFYLEGNNWKGLQIELAERLLKEVNCKLDPIILPWSRALRYLETGKVDFMAEMSITPERQQYLNFIGPQSDETIVIVVPIDSDYQIRSLDDIKDIEGMLGVGQDAWHGEAWARKVEHDPYFAGKLEYETYSSEIQGTRILRDRIFGYVDMLYPWAWRLKHDPAYRGKLKIHDFIVNRGFNYWGFSKKSVDQALLERLRSAYERIKSQDGFEEILEKYR